MQVGAENIALLCVDAALRRTAGRGRSGCRTCRRHSIGVPGHLQMQRALCIARTAVRRRAPHVDLVAINPPAVQRRELARQPLEHEARLRPGLLRLKFRAERQEPEPPRTGPRRSFHAPDIDDFGAEHLEAAADAENQRAARLLLQDLRLEAGAPQPVEVANRTLRARQDQHIRLPELAHARHIADRNARLGRERREVREITDARQTDYRDVDTPLRLSLLERRRQRVLVLQHDIKIRHHTEHRLACPRLEDVEPRIEDRLVAAELVDDEAPDPRPLLRLQQFDRPEQLRKHTSPVDVPDQQHRRIRDRRHAHIDEVVLPEIHLRWTARALDHDDVVLRRKRFVGLTHDRQQRPLVAVVLPRRHIALRHPAHDQLRADIRGRLQQNRIHPRIRANAGGLCLDDLRATHLEPLICDEAVERHVLCLKRGDPVAVLMEDAAEPRHQQTLPRVRHRTLHHDRTRAVVRVLRNACATPSPNQLQVLLVCAHTDPVIALIQPLVVSTGPDQHTFFQKQRLQIRRCLLCPEQDEVRIRHRHINLLYIRKCRKRLHQKSPLRADQRPCFLHKFCFLESRHTGELRRKVNLPWRHSRPHRVRQCLRRRQHIAET